MKIIDLKSKYKKQAKQAATILFDSFKDVSEAWPNIEEAINEVSESFGIDRISRIAVDNNGDVLGWIGGESMYNGNVWEIHPLVIRQDMRGKGIGKSLIIDFEEHVKKLHATTIWLGTDDEDNSTTLSNSNLYDNLFEKIQHIKNIKRHPYEFYQKMGFSIVGVMPDANGIGKPDIYMAKKVGK